MTQQDPRQTPVQRKGLRIVVADDSPLVTAILCDILQKDPGIRVVARARDGREAVDLVAALAPDLVTMDVEMPRMGGIEAIREIMSTRATPILVVTSPAVAATRDLAFEAIGAGALDVMLKPGWTGPDHEHHADNLRRRVRLLADVKVITRRRDPRVPEVRAQETPPESPRACRSVDVVAIGASTGGPQALVEVLRALPASLSACVLIVQHMAAGFMSGLAEWLDVSAPGISVKLADEGSVLCPGLAYLAPGDRHLLLGAANRLVLTEDPPRHACRPSVDELMLSVAARTGATALGVLLTGMGRDGADGLLQIRKAGGTTIAQDQESCIVFGMPGAAVELGAVDALLPLREIGPRVAHWVQGALPSGR